MENNVWSRYIQGAKTLYYSRKLRFDDMFKDRWKKIFNLNDKENLKILEIGCGPGALAGALHRWYPNAEITAVDRDEKLISFAIDHEKGIDFMVGDALSLPFAEGTFDAVISNTVCEHIEPKGFYGEQFRVLKKGGVCLVLSSRKGINDTKYKDFTEYEKKFWEKAEKYDDSIERYDVGKYYAKESEMPVIMERYGFVNVSTDFLTIALTPDDPKFSSELAHDIINSDRYSDIERLDSVLYSFPDHFTEEETEIMKRIANERYDERIEKFEKGERVWDTNVSVIMALRGEKP